jgi:rhodanese-related sulfurtransferase
MAGARLSPLEAQAHMHAGYIYVDVRSPEEFAEGHPAGAFNVPWAFAGAPNEHFLRVMRACFPPGTKLVLGCRSGQRSAAAAAALEAHGWGELATLGPGYDGVRDAFGRILEPGWRRAGLPVDYGEPEGRGWAALLARS